MLILSIMLGLVLTACQSTVQPAEQLQGLSVAGWNIEAVETESNELARILSVRHWKLQMNREGNEEIGIAVSLELIDPDGDHRILDEVRMISDESELETLVAVYPIDESLTQAGQIRIFMEVGSGSTSSVVDNPFGNYSAFYTANLADPVEEGYFRLMAFGDGEPMPSDRNLQLVLRFDRFDPGAD